MLTFIRNFFRTHEQALTNLFIGCFMFTGPILWIVLRQIKGGSLHWQVNVTMFFVSVATFLLGIGLKHIHYVDRP